MTRQDIDEGDPITAGELRALRASDERTTDVAAESTDHRSVATFEGWSVDDLRLLKLLAQTRYDGECMVWTGYRYPPGYGRANLPGSRQQYAHRAVAEIVYGPIPKGMYVLHHCDNPPCVRPDHLYVGTAADNARDREARGRHPHTVAPDAMSRGPRTHCKRGHLLAETGKPLSNGRQRCYVCHQAARKASYLRRRRAA